jgi:hypothetical protein
MTGSLPPVTLQPKQEFSDRRALPARRNGDSFKILWLVPRFKTGWNIRLFLGFAALLTLFSACEWPGVKSAPLREPPLIPRPPELSQQAQSKAESRVANFMDMEDIRNFSPALAQAVTTALGMGVLKPATAQTRFEPERNIVYGEFRQWANDYQDAVNALNQSAMESAAANSPPPAAGPLSPPPALAAHLGNPTMLPVEMFWGSHGVKEQTALSRESLCALAVFLKGQDGVARKLSPAQIQATQPHPDNGSSAMEGSDNADVPLSQLSDYSQVSPWALKYVALAYKNDWLQPVFSLSAAKIATDEGLHPAQSVTRGEALLLLDLLYGHPKSLVNPQPADSLKSNMMQPNANAPSQTLQPTGTTTGTTMAPNRGLKSIGPQTQPPITGLKSMQTPGQKPNPPFPVGHMQAMQEQGPGGTRNALQVSGPE